MDIVVKDQPCLYRPSELDAFLNIAPDAADGFEKARQQLQGRQYPRTELVDILAGYNTAIGNDDKALANIARLADEGTHCVVTGQQVGLLGGPAYTILKAITCLQAACEAGAVPIFWAATEDHDVGEVNHAWHLDPWGNLRRLRLSLPNAQTFVEDITLTDHHQRQIDACCDVLNVPGDIRPSGVVGMAYGEVMVRFLAKMFAGTGLVFVEPRLLRPLAVPFFRRELTDSKDIREALQETTQRLEAAGGNAVLDVEDGTNLFFKGPHGERERVIARADGAFEVKTKKYSLDEILELLDDDPMRFSTGAAARPVLQSAVLPTLAYVAGYGELQYYRQLGDYHRFHDVPMPWIVPRMSATFINAEVRQWLDRAGLTPWQQVPQNWDSIVADIDDTVAGIESDWLAAAARRLGQDNAVTKDSLEHHVHYSVKTLKKKIIKARLHQERIPYHGLHLLRNLLSPHGKPQERVLSWWEFQGKASGNLVEALLSSMHWRERGHHYCFC